MKTLNERIKTLRKEKGLTQSQLADKLGVTDKAVSKWEVGEANPDIELLAKLAEIFDVTIDYLLTGKIEEKISIDDMDEEKRALYLIKKDDVKGFQKYNCFNPCLLFCQPYYGSLNRKLQNLFDAIYQYEPVGIFKYCIAKALQDRQTIQSLEQYGGLAVRGDLDKYIRMCRKAKCVEGLKAIDLKYFAIGLQTSNQDRIRFHIREGSALADQDYSTCSLSSDTLSYLFSPEGQSNELLDYLSEIEFFRDQGNKVYLMTDDVILELYRNKYFDRLEKALEAMEEYNVFAKEKYDESLSDSWYTGKKLQGNAIYFINNSHGAAYYLQALVSPIDKAFKLAEEEKDLPWIKKFNEFNKKLIDRIPKVHAYTLKEDKIKFIEMENSNEASLEDLLSLKHTKNGILDISGFLSDDYGLKATEDVAMLKEKIQRVRQLKTFVKGSFISPYELLITLVDDKKGKELFKFATDLQYRELEDAVIDGNEELIKALASDLFLPSNDIILTFLEKKEKAHNACASGDENEKEAAKLAYKKIIYEARDRANKEFIEEKTSQYGCHLNNEMYKSLLILQVQNLPIDECYRSLTLDYISKEKERICDRYITKLAGIIEEITNKKAYEREYNKITAELSKEYLISELDRGEADKVVVLICKRLQIILEHKFGYSGDLFTMIDTLIDKTMKLHNCTDNEDNSYYEYLEEDRLFTKRIQLLHKLRMKRNNIVHAEIKEVEISKEDIRECIDLLELLSK